MMNVRTWLAITSFAAPAVTLLAAPQTVAHRTLRSAVVLTAFDHPRTQAPPPWAEDDPADSLYRQARQALNDESFREAARLFAQINARYPKSAYAAEALYFRAYALYRNGSQADLRDALASLDLHHSRFPRGRMTSDADQLAVRIRGELAKRGDASEAAKVNTLASSSGASCRDGSDDRDDVRGEAMNALLQMDAQSALPIIKQVLARRDACSTSLRKKAVFLLSQKPTSETESTLIDVIRNDPSEAVREDGVFWLGQIHTDRAAALLEEMATTSADTKLRERALFSLSQQNSARGNALMRRIAESNDTPARLREHAIFQIGQHRSSENADFLKQLFGRLGAGPSGDAARKHVLFSLSQMRGFDNGRWLANIAVDESQSDDVRKQALFTAGQAGVSGGELTGLYDRLTSRVLKEQLIWVMSDSKDPVASDRLVTIAKSDKDPEMRKKAIFWLGQKNDPRVRQILLDILK